MSTTTETTATRGYSIEIMSLVHDILTLAMTTPKEVADIFVSYSPHVNHLEVTVHAHGWTQGVAHSKQDFCYLDGGHDGGVERLRNIHESLANHFAELRGQSETDIRAAKAAALRERAAQLTAEAAALEGGDA